jgi:hypothetical protein
MNIFLKCFPLVLVDAPLIHLTLRICSTRSEDGLAL